MIDRNTELLAYQGRLRELCGGMDTVTVKDLQAATGFTKNDLYDLINRAPRLRKIGSRYFVLDVAERIFEAFRPAPRRCG